LPRVLAKYALGTKVCKANPQFLCLYATSGLYARGVNGRQGKRQLLENLGGSCRPRIATPRRGGANGEYTNNADAPIRVFVQIRGWHTTETGSTFSGGCAVPGAQRTVRPPVRDLRPCGTNGAQRSGDGSGALPRVFAGHTLTAKESPKHMPSDFIFTIERADATCGARAGVMRTPHGDIPTPVFAPVGTQATVKTLTPDELVEMGTTLILANTYHLYLRPGADLIARLGGLHQFMGWTGPILTDSGGFQLFSLESLRRVSEEGVLFRSHIDGSEHSFSPEKAIEIQEKLGADIIMALDECPDPMDYDYNRSALERTHRWAERCLQAHTRADQALFGILQGGIFPDLRRESAQFLTSLDFPGYGIGGLSVGEPKEKTWEMVDITVPLLPADKPRYLMGVGSPEDLFESVERGIDLLDCALPTRLARNGAVFTSQGRINLRKAEFAEDPAPIEEGCGCYTCRHFSRAYLRHLLKAGEILGLRLNTIHNLYFLLELMRRIRAAILEGNFLTLKESFLSHYTPITDKTGQRGRTLARRRGKAT